MKFADVMGERRQAEPGMIGHCDACGRLMIAKCGEIRRRHWAHKGRRNCDPWWEPETDWHRAWKDHFPEHWQEKHHVDKKGEKHRADVKTDSGLVIEFQHSTLPSGERACREDFYRKMVWVVDGRRRSRDRRRLVDALGTARFIGRLPYHRVSIDEGALLRDWCGSRVPVYFDFGQDMTGKATLLRLHPITRDGWAYLSPVLKAEFLRVHLAGSSFEDELTSVVAREVDVANKLSARPTPLADFERYSRRQEARRRRRPSR